MNTYMKRILFGLGIFGLGCASAPLVIPPLSAQQSGVTRWEYTCYADNGGLNMDQLNQYGAQGWELVGPRDPGAQLCFKRPL